MSHLRSLGLALALLGLMVGCTSVLKVEGDYEVGKRLVVKVAEPWNKIPVGGGNNPHPFELWTMEGLPLDQLRFWVGIAPGQSLLRKAPTAPAGQVAPRAPTYVAGMGLDQLVNLFEILYASDGSMITITKIDAAEFVGERGARFEFSVLRKGDDVALLGVGWVAVRKAELFAATFVAPKLSFFPRLLPKAEAVIRSAQIKG